MRALGGPGAGDGAIGVGNHITGIGFEIGVIDELGFVCIFQNYIRLGETFFNISFSNFSSG